MHARLRPVRKIRKPPWVNDTHSALNRTQVTRVLEPRGVPDVAEWVAQVQLRGEPLAISGARHAMQGLFA